ncbi:hypothetical protein Poli38472_006901 [Pythium oligandrum]|uniref:Uncharacterized protein n=1 Tax=Pythium oligandrum TaxID=41045 RepID=A0A8K1FDV0_PYTOL|nr:hypothetical protein Poli38472_006901 [Pythium oligandrum]|eukprot:TMW58756.1 hypothetical protein Poli38472_006901 [Pythium oligandrum]
MRCCKQLRVALKHYHDATRSRLEERLLNNQDQLLELWDEYIQTLELQHAITHENQLLTERIDEFLMLECRLLLPEFHNSDEDAGNQSDEMRPAEPTELFDARGFWTHFMDEYDAPFYFECYRASECRAILQRSYQTMVDDIQRVASHEWGLHSGCFGWKGYGQVDATNPALVRFQFIKRLRAASSANLVAEMTRETSRIFHSSKLYGRLYGMRMESQVLQRVNDHASVILQSLSDEHRTLSLRSIMLFGRVEESDKSTTIMNVVIPPRSVPRPPPERMILYIHDCLIYMRLTPVNDEEVDVVYGGHADCLSPELARICVLESVSSFFRWVQHVVPQRLVTSE